MPIATPSIPTALWDKVRGMSAVSQNKAMELIQSTSWKDPKVEDGMSVTTMSVEGNKNHALRATLEIPHPIQCCFGAFVTSVVDIDENSNAKARKATLFRHETFESEKYVELKAKYKDYIKQQTVQNFPELEAMSTVAQFVVTSPSSLVAHREFITIHDIKELPKNNGKRRFLCTFMTPDLPELMELFPEATKQEGWVRGMLHINGFLFEETAPGSDKTMATFVCHSDPMGKVPAMLANSVLVGQAKSLNNLVQLIKTAGAK